MEAEYCCNILLHLQGRELFLIGFLRVHEEKFEEMSAFVRHVVIRPSVHLQQFDNRRVEFIRQLWDAIKKIFRLFTILVVTGS